STAAVLLGLREEVAQQRGEPERAVALHAVARPPDALGAQAGLAPPQLEDVLVGGYAPERAAPQPQRHARRRDVCPEGAEVRCAAAEPPAAHRVVAPDPAAILELARVVEDAAPQRRARARRVEAQRALEDRVEALEALRARDEGDDRLRLRVVG